MRGGATRLPPRDFFKKKKKKKNHDTALLNEMVRRIAESVIRNRSPCLARADGARWGRIATCMSWG